MFTKIYGDKFYLNMNNIEHSNISDFLIDIHYTPTTKNGAKR